MNTNLPSIPFSEGNHIVTAVTEEAVNNIMKQKLYSENMEYDTFVLFTVDEVSGENIYFELNEFTDISLMPKEFPDDLRRKSLFSELKAFNLFLIPIEKEKRSQAQIDILKKVYTEYKVCSAFQLITGYPADYSIFDKQSFYPINLILSKEPSGCGVDYIHAYHEIIIINIHGSEEAPDTDIVTQSSTTPWYFRYKIMFGLKNISFASMPKDEKQYFMKRFDYVPESRIPDLFDISSLMLDISTLTAIIEPEITGVDKDTLKKLYHASKNCIVNCLSEQLTNGYFIKPSSSNTYNYIVKPVKFSYSITRCPETAESRYSTLNYIMSTTEDDIVTQDYYWSWVSPNDANKSSGVAAIRRDVFFDKIGDEFKNKLISKLRLHFIASMEGNHKCLWDMKYCCSIEHDTSPDPGTFTHVAYDHSYTYDPYSFSSDSGMISVYVPPAAAATGQLKMKYSFNCTAKYADVESEGVVYPGLVFTIEVILYTEIYFDAQPSKGNIYHHTIDCWLGIAIDEYGRFKFIKRVDDKDHGDKIDISTLAKIFTFGGVVDLVKDIDRNVEGIITQVIQSFIDAFTYDFADSCNWVMVGNKTFIFKEEGFSDYKDFYTKVTYVNPNSIYSQETEEENRDEEGGR